MSSGFRTGWRNCIPLRVGGGEDRMAPPDITVAIAMCDHFPLRQE